MDWNDLTREQRFDVWVVHAALLGQTVFLLLWAVLPWFRTWVGRALMIKSAALWLLFAVNLSLFWVALRQDHPWVHAETLSISTHVLVTLGIWSQVAAIGWEMFDACRERRRGGDTPAGADEAECSALP